MENETSKYSLRYIDEQGIHREQFVSAISRNDVAKQLKQICENPTKIFIIKQ
jgi:predicted transcriptional regulator